MDTIRRLINNGLLNEAQDESDKRAKLIVLTPLGREVLEMAARKISDKNSMFFAAVNEINGKRFCLFWKKSMNSTTVSIINTISRTSPSCRT